MGGHGGLNILPQKSWHVYNQDNRYKVAKDEAEERAAQEAAGERALAAEREHRRKRLLDRAGLSSAGHNAGAVACVECSTQGADFNSEKDMRVSSEVDPVLEHINFWREDELKLKAQHPENVKQQLDDNKKRGGKEEFYTSDAKFDERFQLGYAMAGDKPWYAQAPSRSRSSKERVDQQSVVGHRSSVKGRDVGLPMKESPVGLPAPLPSCRVQGMSMSNSSSSGSESDSGCGSDSSGSRHRSKSRRSKRKSKSTHKSHKSHKSSSKPHSESKRGKEKRSKKRHRSRRSSEGEGTGGRGEGGSGGSGTRIEQLRAERVKREMEERERERRVMIGAVVDKRNAKSDRSGYSATFGYAADLKKRKMA